MTIPGKRIIPTPITAGVNVKDLVDNFMSAYNGARLREACQVMAQKIMQPGVTVGLTITGALTPAGIGYSCVVPLIEAGLSLLGQISIMTFTIRWVLPSTALNLISTICSFGKTRSSESMTFCLIRKYCSSPMHSYGG